MEWIEAGRDGSLHLCRLRISKEAMQQKVDEALARLGATLRLPGFRPGKIPLEVLRNRYGAATQQKVAQELVDTRVRDLLNEGWVPAALNSVPAATGWELDFRLTRLSELPALETFPWQLPEGADPREALLDQLDAAYPFPLASALVQQELKTLLAALAQDVPAEELAKSEVQDELRQTAERRVRLGLVLAEMARRSNWKPTEEELHQAQKPGESVEWTRTRLMEEQMLARLLAAAHSRPNTAETGTKTLP